MIRLIHDFRFFIWRNLAADVLRTRGWGPQIAWDYTGTMRDYFDAGALPIHALDADRHVWEMFQ